MTEDREQRGDGSALLPPSSVFRLLASALCLLSSVLSVLALGPHEVLLLANRQSPRSMAIARDYAALRQIPAGNLVLLELPAQPALEITPAAFMEQIWTPARQAMAERGLSDHILAWVYSVDFPIRITASPSLSIQGLTFLKGQLPAREIVEKGSFASPLFAGPEHPASAGFPPQSLDAQQAWLGKEMPLPSMMLGYMGPNGNSLEEIMACLQTGTLSDRTRPSGAFLMATNDDVRSLCRAWQIAPALRELSALGMVALVTNVPASATPLNGFMTGAADLPEIARGRLRFHPGAIAEHLTSFGAVFDTGSQTKISAWIRAGATATAGTVTEPFALWPKFPHARVFACQVAGCTTLESLIQSIRCPLQILLVGEPLASPWAPQSRLAIRGLENSVLDTPRQVTAEITPRDDEVFNRFMFLLDGKTYRRQDPSPAITLTPAAIGTGHHKLRIVAYRVGSVRSQIFAETSFDVK